MLLRCCKDLVKKPDQETLMSFKNLTQDLVKSYFHMYIWVRFFNKNNQNQVFFIL